MIVATDNLSKEYDGVYRVQELDIRIKEGDIYGFLGPNGAGKSTTMKMLLGLVKPTSGTIEIMGKPFNEKTRRDILSSVGSLIESPSYYGHLTGRENMEIIRRLLDLPKKEHRRSGAYCPHGKADGEKSQELFSRYETAARHCDGPGPVPETSDFG